MKMHWLSILCGFIWIKNMQKLPANRLHPSRHWAVHAEMKEEAQTVDSQWQNPLRHHEVILQITTFSESLSQML